MMRREPKVAGTGAVTARKAGGMRAIDCLRFIVSFLSILLNALGP
jgi:hypothetical protein